MKKLLSFLIATTMFLSLTTSISAADITATKAESEATGSVTAIVEKAPINITITPIQLKQVGKTCTVIYPTITNNSGFTVKLQKWGMRITDPTWKFTTNSEYVFAHNIPGFICVKEADNDNTCELSATEFSYTESNTAGATTDIRTFADGESKNIAVPYAGNPNTYANHLNFVYTETLTDGAVIGECFFVFYQA